MSRTPRENGSVTVRLNCTRPRNQEDDTEDDMQNLVMLGQAALGLGVFFMGVAALWFVSIYQTKKE